MTSLIQLDTVSKSFGTKQVLADVSLGVDRGRSLAIIGGSGTGKSVMLKCILGLIVPDAGRISFDGRPIGEMRDPFLSRFGMLFQGGALFDSMPVWQNVVFRLLHDGMPRATARARAEAKLARVGLSADVARLYPAELSGGMQKRVALARAIATDPEVIFFDEPTSGLDPIMARVINDLIREIVTETGATTITITHDMTSVRTIADTVALLHAGRVQWTGPVAAMDGADDAHLRQFLTGSTNGPIDTLR